MEEYFDNVVAFNTALADGLVKAYDDGYEQGKKDAVRHGKWNEVQIKLFEDAPTKGFECSLCKNGWFNVDGFIFCPNCGAKMW